MREKERAICDRFDEYAKYPAFSGILASDEPPASKFTAIRTVQDWFCGRYPGKEFIVNLLPTYANAEQLSGDEGIENFDYEKDYVNAFIDIVDPQILSYDHYALIYDKKNDENVMRADYLRNLEIFAECSRRTGKPFYNFMLTIGHLFYRTVRAYEDIAWQVYTSLAYGCTGMQTFTYWTLLSNGEAENITSALVLRDGGQDAGMVFHAASDFRSARVREGIFEISLVRRDGCGRARCEFRTTAAYALRASRDRGTESGRPLRRRHFRKRRNVRAVDRGTDSKGRRYVDGKSRGYTHLDAQAEILKGNSAMVVSGPWMQIEMSEYLVDYPGFRMGIMPTRISMGTQGIKTATIPGTCALPARA